MTQKNNISATVITICAALALSACITKKREKNNTGGITLATCKAQRKDYDSFRKVCIAPNERFCATNFSMVKGIGACRAPVSSSECQALGNLLKKTMHWSGNQCQLLGGTTGSGQLDSNISIKLTNFKNYPVEASQFVEVGRITVTISNTDLHQVNVLKKSGATCQLRHSKFAGKIFTVEAKGPASKCEGKILVFNTKTGNYNVKDFSVTLK